MKTSLKLLAAAGVAVVVGLVLFSSPKQEVPLASAAAVDFFLKIEGVEGVIAPIDIESWSWGIVSPRDAASGLPTGKRQYQPIIIRKRIDKSSPLLAKTSNDGGMIKKVTLTGMTDNKQKYQVSFFDVFIEAYVNSDEPGVQPMEQISFSFDKIAFEY